MPALSTHVQSTGQHQHTANIVQQVQQQSSGTSVVVTQQPPQRNDNAKEKCRKFLTNLIELSKREPKNVEKNVRTLIQELVDANVEPEEFCKKLERLLNASPQPCLIGFLKVCSISQKRSKGTNIFCFHILEKSAAFKTVASD